MYHIALLNLHMNRDMMCIYLAHDVYIARVVPCTCCVTDYFGEQRRRALLRSCKQKGKTFSASVALEEVITVCCPCKPYKPQVSKGDEDGYDVEAELFQLVRNGEETKVRCVSCMSSDCQHAGRWEYQLQLFLVTDDTFVLSQQHAV